MQNQLHLIKLAVGVETVEELKAYQVKYCRKHTKKRFIHITRQMPKRAEELLNGGSLYWVIKGFVRARQRIVELQKLVVNEVPHCGIVLAPEVIKTVSQPRRPFQGWRYLTLDKAPKDIADGDSDISDMPEAMLRELTELGLL